MRQSRTGGFTLVEVVVSTVLLALMIAGAYVLARQTNRLGADARDHYVAASISLARVERARHLDLTALGLLQETQQIVNDQGDPAEDNLTEGRFRRTTQVWLDDPREGLVRVRVTTEIRDPGTGDFLAGQEVMECLYTAYLERPDVNP